MSSNTQYAEQYAELAMEQMREYGIPASVILAQAILESSNGQSRLALNENNHFGIKATEQWIEQGGRYALYTDDRPNERFCSYDSVRDSYEHHSRFLAENSRYAGCFALSPDDYKGWTEGLAEAGYASGGDYAQKLQQIIERNGLQQYDSIVMAEMAAQGLEIGAGQKTDNESYSFPVRRDEFMFVTSPFGMRADPADPERRQMHRGIDISCDSDAVLATENNGKVVAVGLDADAPEGRSVTIEYERPDGSRIQNVYMHLSDIDVSVGDSVQAGQKIGLSGTAGESLHFGVTQINSDGTRRDVDPAVYLAEIAEKGDIRIQALHDGSDLLAKYRTDTASESQESESLSPEDWMRKLLSSEDSGVSMSGTNDPIVDMMVKAFSSLMLLAAAIDGKSDEEQIENITAMAKDRKVDLTPLMPQMKSCSIVIDGNDRAVLQADDGSVQVSRELSAGELGRLSAILNNTGLSEEGRQMRVAGMVNSIILSEQASQNFEQGLSEGQTLNEQLRR